VRSLHAGAGAWFAAATEVESSYGIDATTSHLSASETSFAVISERGNGLLMTARNCSVSMPSRTSVSRMALARADGGDHVVAQEIHAVGALQRDERDLVEMRARVHDHPAVHLAEQIEDLLHVIGLNCLAILDVRRVREPAARSGASAAILSAHRIEAGDAFTDVEDVVGRPGN